MPTPPDRKYMMKLIGPSQIKGVMSLSQDHEENLCNYIKKYGIKPHELTQITLNTVDEKGKPKKGRDINQQYINAARKVGVNLVLIDHGDFVPGIRAALDPDRRGNKPMIVIGRSGFEEATMDAAVAKALGGFAEAQEYFVLPESPDKKFCYDLGKYLSLDDMVPAPKDEILVTVGSVTGDNEHFNMPRPRKHSDNRSHLVRALAITHRGIHHQDIHLASY
jgi:fructose-1,6-bisphosphatase/sedoheptulose 1,7-bisphosphatase-like protein